MLRVTSRILATGSYQPSGKLGTLDRNNNKTVGGSYIQNRIKKINKLHYPMIDSARLSNYQMSKHSWEMGIRNISTARDEKFRKLGMYRKYEVQKNVKGMRSIREKYGRTILETLKGDVVGRRRFLQFLLGPIGSR